MTEVTSNIGNTYSYQKVLLSPITDDQAGVLDNNLEPPFVRVRNRNASLTFVDTFDTNSHLANNNFLIGSNGSLLAKRTKRFSINFFSAQNPQPNINERNNTINFTTAAGTFTVTIPAGFYTRTQAIAALLVALNSVSGASLVVFTAPNQFVNSDVYIVLTGTLGFRINNVAACTFATTGYAFWGFLRDDTRMAAAAPLALTMTLGPITALYTRYYDVCSSSLLQHTKAANTGSRVPANIIFRIYTSQIVGGDSTGSFFHAFDIASDNSAWNFDASHSLSTIDLQLYDEFQQPLYLPNGSTNASWLQVSLVNEL